MSEARWATHEDANAEIEFCNVTTKVNSDLTAEEVTEIQYKILKDTARESIGTQRVQYDSGYQEFKLIEAKTIVNGTTYPVPKKNIEDRPTASRTTGFDESNLVQVAYPHIETGARVYLKYSLKLKKSPLEGVFSTSFAWGVREFERTGKVKIDSEIPIHVQANDPEHKVKITETRVGYRYHVEIQQLSPAFYRPVDEAGPWLDRERVPWVRISNHKTWATAAVPLLSRYERVLAQPLPSAFVQISEEAKKKTSPTDRFNSVTSQLATMMTYKGDWKTVEGKWIPHDLNHIAELKLGDCKDFSAATAAILRKLGYEAHLAVINRGPYPDPKEDYIPTHHSFNHAIVYAKANGKIYWIDPTNPSSFAHGMYPDIAGRPAMVLTPKEPLFLKTPDVGPQDAAMKFSESIELEDLDTSSVKANIILSGGAAAPWAGADLNWSKKNMNYALMRWFGDEEGISNWKIDDVDLTSRVVSDLLFHVEFTSRNSSLITTAGYALPLRKLGETFVVKTEDRVSDVFLGMKLSVSRETRLQNVAKIGNLSMDCKAESPWADIHRRVEEEGGGIRIIDDFQIKKLVIKNSELQTSQYQEFKRAVRLCSDRGAVVYTLKGRRELASDQPGKKSWLDRLKAFFGR